MKKKIILALCSLIMICFAFTGCALSGGPSTTDVVYGNGGLVVQKGNWLYFAGGYEAYSTLEQGNKNKLGSVTVSALYRTEMGEDGSVELDEDGYPTNYQQVVSKVVGFDYGGIYIFGDQLYFTSPNTAKDKEGAYHFDQVSFFKCNLNGTGLTEIYTTSNFSSTCKYVINKISNVVTITVLDGTNLVKIEANGNQTTLAENVTGAMMVNQEDFALASIVPSLLDTAFITRARTEEEGSGSGVTGNILEKITISTGSKTIVSGNADTAIELKAITYSRVFYSKTNSLTSDGYIFSSGFNSEQSEIQHTVINGLTNIIAFDDNANSSYSGFVFTKDSKVYYQAFNDMYNFTELLTTNSTVLNCVNGKVFYKNESGGVSVITVATKISEDVSDGATTLQLENAYNIDFSTNHIFFLEKQTGSSNYYLYRYSLSDADDKSVELLSKPLDSDITDEEE
ncbi:MAG: hypothetical protein WCR30_00775 [Clostridia bacterium]